MGYNKDTTHELKVPLHEVLNMVKEKYRVNFPNNSKAITIDIDQSAASYNCKISFTWKETVTRA